MDNGVLENPQAAVTSVADARRRLIEEYLRRGSVDQAVQPAIAPRAGNQPVPLSWGQQLLWLHTQLSPDAPIYNEPITIHRSGPLDVPALERSLTEILRRHEAWRTTFEIVDGRPVQVVRPAPAIRFPLIDLRALPHADAGAEAVRLATEDARRTFDLAQGPLLRGIVVRLGEADYRIYLTLHHIIFDGFSTYSVLLRELTALYGAITAEQPSPLPDLPLQYGDYAVWQRSRTDETMATQMSYWRHQLADASDLELPFDRPRPQIQTIPGAVQRVALSKALTEQLRSLAQREGVTLFMTLLAAFETLLHRYSGQDDFVIGTVTAGRSRPEVQDLLGFFLNPLMLRADLSGNPTFRSLLLRVRDVTLGALAHEDVPFELLVKALRPKRDPSRNPLYQVLFSLQPPMATHPQGWNVTMWDIETGTAKLDLYLELDDRPEGIVGRFVFNTDLFDASTIARMSRQWQTLLEAVVADPDRQVSRLQLLTENERRRLASRSNDVGPVNAFRRFEREDIDQTITHRFERLVEDHPTHVAIKTPQGDWTYGTLNAAANRVGHAILARRGSGSEQVALLLQHGADMIAAVLGTLKAGKVYVPLDPSYPQERLRQVLEDSQASAIVTNRANRALATELAGDRAEIIDLDEIDSGSFENPGIDRSPESLAYLLYTSGSTGRPKGVMQSHRNVLHFISAYTNALHIHPDDRLSLIASYSFDAAVMDIYGALLNGATLCPFDIRVDGIAGLAHGLEAMGVTIYHSTPTVYRHLLASLQGTEDLSRLRMAVLGGEEVLTTDVERHRQHFPQGTLLVNLSGQTESSMNTLYFIGDRTPVGRGSVPIGYAVDGTHVLLLDPDGQPADLRGEICIRSPHVALGYWRQPEQTRRVFLSESSHEGVRTYRTGDLGRVLPDGSLQFAGRRDLQVKIRGVRVELGAVEAALSGHPSIRSAAARAWDVEAGVKRLVAYCVPVPGVVLRDAALREFLREKLPDAMVPSAFVTLDALPQTPSGKIDRRALPPPNPTPYKAVSGCAAPRDETEARLSAIWGEVLDVASVGIDSDFFDLGGHSLLAIRMFDEIQKALGVRLPPSTLFRHSTIADLARVIAATPSGHLAGEQSPPPVIALHTTGQRPPFFFLHAAVFGDAFYSSQLGRLLGPDQPFYGLAPLGVDGRPIPDTVEEMAAVYVALIRARQPGGPYQIGAFSRSGPIAIELARQLTQAGETVSAVVIVDSLLVNASILAQTAGRCLDTIACICRLPLRWRAALFLALKQMFGTKMTAISPQHQATMRERVRQHYNRATHAYVPRCSEIPLVHLWTEGRGCDDRWRRVTTRLIQRMIPGDHQSCVTQHLAQTAAVLSSFLIAS